MLSQGENAPFFDHLKSLYSQKKKSPKLSSWQDLFWEKFCTLGLPEKHHEAFQYFPLQSVYANHYALPGEKTSLPKVHNSKIIFVDGQYRPDLSDFSELPKNVVILPLEEAIGLYGAFLQNRMRKLMQEEKNPFVFANLALCQNGLFIYVPPKTILQRPLEILHIVTSEETSRILSPSIYVYMGQHSQAECLYESSESGSMFWRNEMIDITLDEGADFHLYPIATTSPQSCFTSTLRASVKRDGHLHVTPVTSGSKAIRYDYHVTLLGENSQATLRGLSSLHADLHSHVHGIVEHVAPHTQSMQLFKTVARDRSRASFQGKIVVRDTAQKTEAYQLSKQLLLGEHAICNVKPNLEIFADDVKASHGATVSQLAQEELFYLKTRGILEEDARRLFVEGFCRDILQEIPQSNLLESFL